MSLFSWPDSWWSNGGVVADRSRGSFTWTGATGTIGVYTARATGRIAPSYLARVRYTATGPTQVGFQAARYARPGGVQPLGIESLATAVLPASPQERTHEIELRVSTSGLGSWRPIIHPRTAGIVILGVEILPKAGDGMRVLLADGSQGALRVMEGGREVPVASIEEYRR